VFLFLGYMKLKSSTYFLFALLSCFYLTKAQSQSLKIDYGPNLGAVFSVLDTENLNATENSITGLTAGFFLEISSVTSFSFQAELMYTEQGAELNSDILQETINIDYLQVPLLGKFNILELFNIHAGPQFGFLTSDLESENYDAENFDVLAVAGVGVDIGKLRANLRYNFGFTEVIDAYQANNLYYSFTIAYELF